MSLERKESFKDLGVILDKKLTFRDHIHDKINKAYSMLGIIVTNLSLVGSMAIDIRMTCERDPVLPASCVKSFLADRTI